MRMKSNVALATIACVLLTACASLYTSTVTITEVVDSAMKNWAELSVAGKTSPAIDSTVMKAHNTYREACAFAQGTLIEYKATGNSTDYARALTAVRNAASGLISLISPLITPNKAADLRSSLAKAGAL